MDVTKASTLQLWNTPKSYATTLATGKEELDRLRSMTDIVSLQDQKLEAERVEIDRQYNDKQAKRLEEEQEIRLERQQQAREIRLERQEIRLERQAERVEQEEQALENRQAEQEKKAPVIVGRTNIERDGMGDPLLAVGAASLVGVAGLFGASGSVRNDKPPTVRDDDAITTPSAADTTTSLSKEEDILELEDTIQKSLVEDAIEEELLNHLDPFEESAEQPTTTNRVEAAEKAMQEYLDEDDGGENWLTVMSEIVEDDSEELSTDWKP